MVGASDSSRSFISRGRSMMRRSRRTVACSPLAVTDCGIAPLLPRGPPPITPPAAARAAADSHSRRAVAPAAEGFAAGAASPSAPVVGSRRLEAACQRVLTRQQSERDRDLSPPGNAELLSQHVTVSLRGARRNAELETDLVVRQTLRDQFDDLPLTGGDA